MAVHLNDRKISKPNNRLASLGETPAPGLSRSTITETLIIGLGNPLVTDDSVGLRVARRLRDSLEDHREIEVTEDYWGGLRLMERMIGHKRAIVVDAIQSGAPPGTLHLLSIHSMPTQRRASAHDMDLPTALAFGRGAGVELPADEAIRLVGIEAEDIINFGETCTPAVEAAIPEAVRCVLRMIEAAHLRPRRIWP